MKLSLKAKTLVAIALFAVLFCALIVVATFYDYQISEILTKNALPSGEYYATDFFGVLLESIGTSPIYLFAAFCCCVLFWVCVKVWKKKPFNSILAVVFGIATVVAFWFAVKDSIGYIFDHVFKVLHNPEDIEAVDGVYHSAATYGIEVFFALILAGLALLATKHFKEETLKSLFKLCITAVIAVAVANLLIAIVKGPVGRMRFRAINSTLGQEFIANGEVSGFTKWFVANGQPSDAVREAFEKTYGASDAFKSFPSGHTCAAATTYALVMLPDVIEFKHKKGAKIACWATPIVITMLVAISRIVVGAHYMSDVTMGGTIAFLCVIIAREVLICKGSHFFALFPQLKKEKAVAVNGEGKAVEDDAQDVQSCGTCENENVENAIVENGTVDVEQANVGEAQAIPLDELQDGDGKAE